MEIYATSPDLPSIIDAVQRGSIDDVDDALRRETSRIDETHESEDALIFAVRGRNSDMVMYDRETESWQKKAIGTGIVREMNGVELITLPTWMESWRQFAERNPDGLG